MSVLGGFCLACGLTALGIRQHDKRALWSVSAAAWIVAGIAIEAARL